MEGPEEARTRQVVLTGRYRIRLPCSLAVRNTKVVARRYCQIASTIMNDTEGTPRRIPEVEREFSEIPSGPPTMEVVEQPDGLPVAPLSNRTGSTTELVPLRADSLIRYPEERFSLLMDELDSLKLDQVIGAKMDSEGIIEWASVLQEVADYLSRPPEGAGQHDDRDISLWWEMRGTLIDFALRTHEENDGLSLDAMAAAATLMSADELIALNETIKTMYLRRRSSPSVEYLERRMAESVRSGASAGRDGTNTSLQSDGER